MTRKILYPYFPVLYSDGYYRFHILRRVLSRFNLGRMELSFIRKKGTNKFF